MSILSQTGPAPMSPSALQASIAADLVRIRAMKTQLDALQDALDETRYPSVPYDHPSWDDADRWELGPAIPPNAFVTPVPLGPPTDAELAAFWPGSDS